MYDWRKLTPGERDELLADRKARQRPWHTPPHHLAPGTRQYILSAACFEHASIIGKDPARMDFMADRLLATAQSHCDKVYSWCLLPNHYHVVLQTSSVATLLRAIGQLHGLTSYLWNGEENCRGRKVWFNAVEREMRSEAHLWASINYVHHNLVKHGYVNRWQDWPWSSARAFLEEVGNDRAREIWEAYPVLDYGQGWDD